MKIRDFFYHNSTERKATAVLLSIVLCLIVLTWIWPYFAVTKKYNFENFEKEIAEFEAGLVHLEGEEELNFKRYSSDNKFSDRKYRSKDIATEVKELNPFSFNPNTADSLMLSDLGLQVKTVKGILNYRSKGGKFRTKSDFSKIYTLSEEQFAILEPYIELPDSLERKDFTEKESIKTKDTEKKSRIYRNVEINSATEEDFKSLPGIGPSFASRIVKFRNSLGGFVKKEQIAEVYGFPDSTYLRIEPYLECNKKGIKRININTADAEELKSHPYLRWKHANAIVKYREKNGAFNDIELLRTIQEFDDADGTYWKIKPYLEI